MTYPAAAWKSLADLPAYLEKNHGLTRFEAELNVLTAIMVHRESITIPELASLAGFEISSDHVQALHERMIVTALGETLHANGIPEPDSDLVKHWSGPEAGAGQRKVTT